MIRQLKSQIDFVENEEDFLSSENDETVIVILEKTEAIYGADDSCDTEWCDKNSIPYAHQDKLQGGGCIIGVKGNVFVDAKRLSEGECLSDRFSKAFAVWLKEKGLKSVRTDNNDVLVDGFKVASGCETVFGKWAYMGYQISINQDIETIKNACKKEMVKTPKGLGEFGVTTEEIVSFCNDYWDKN